MLRTTHTYVLLDLSQPAYDEIANKLKAAGYDHAFQEDGAIDMHGIAVIAEMPPPQQAPAEDEEAAWQLVAEVRAANDAAEARRRATPRWILPWSGV